ncbi:MAG: type IV secretory system conjugative DNA transfer family protein, partial [bacterium]|nr:type IV secretory system conjugative DNA transfer family protein [bacterium]
LSPWLGHLMVSRQETARPLLTPGEVMQLSPADELVLVSGVPPIRAQKARYFEDPRLTERVLAPPQLASGQSGAAPSDDWSQLPVPAVAPAGRDVDASGKGRIGDPANAGIRREPELPEHEEIAPEQAKSAPEFVFGEEDPDDDAVRARALRQQARGLARQAAMDPGDGIDL